ncbi:MAG: hypothetical protein HZB39_13640, partial [Planctomycetes bacterium]|nr:hypothetical protein [Planctomycetota bacterium]
MTRTRIAATGITPFVALSLFLFALPVRAQGTATAPAPAAQEKATHPA